MEKEVNGVRITLDEDAMQLFELSIMGSHTRKKLDNLVTSDLNLPDYTRNMVEYFCSALKKLPDPLIAACCTLKYVVVVREMIRELNKANLPVPKLVPCNYGILVVSRDQMHIVLQERTWALAANNAGEEVTNVDSDKLLDMESFADEKYFRFFDYVDKILAQGGRIKNREFLTFALPALVKQCETDTLLRWEMSKLLIFEPYSDAGETLLKSGSLVDMESKKAIKLQLFWTGKSEKLDGTKIIQVNLTTKTTEDVQDERKIYDYNVDVLTESGLITRLIKSKHLFKSIAEFMMLKVYDGKSIQSMQATGLINAGYIVANVDNFLIVGKLGENFKLLCTDASIINLTDKGVATFAIDKQNQLNQVNIRTVMNYDINMQTSKIAAKLFSTL